MSSRFTAAKNERTDGGRLPCAGRQVRDVRTSRPVTPVCEHMDVDARRRKRRRDMRVEPAAEKRLKALALRSTCGLVSRSAERRRSS